MAKTHEIETVTMADGRVVEFAGKRKLIKTSTINADGQVQVALDFRNGETRLFTVPPTFLTKFAAHGAEQKLGDEIAGLEDIGDCVLAIDELIDRLYNGEWLQRRESGGMAGTSILLRALVESTGKSPEVLKAFLAKKTHAEKLALRDSDRLRGIVARLEAEKLAKKPKVDTEGLFGELEG